MGVSDFEKSKKSLQPSQGPILARDLHEVLGPAVYVAQDIVSEEFAACNGQSDHHQSSEAFGVEPNAGGERGLSVSRDDSVWNVSASEYFYGSFSGLVIRFEIIRS